MLLHSAESEEFRLLPFRSPAALEVFEYGRELQARRRAQPSGDLISLLVTAEVEGAALNQQELDNYFLLLVLAGQKTTRQAITLAEAIYDAGGEPLVVLPSPELLDRLAFADGVLLPGGGDVDPCRYGEAVAHGDVYDIDELQDEFDLAVAGWALTEGVPLLAVCRGMQVVNVSLGGTLEQHMPEPHRHIEQEFEVDLDSQLLALVGKVVSGSCFHHQRLARLGGELIPVAWAADGTVEAVELPHGAGWFLGVQWHPEDTVSRDPSQRVLFGEFVDQAARRHSRRA